MNQSELQKTHKASTDRIFNQVINPLPPFRFDNKVAEVFDDMVHRSIPIYSQTHQIMLQLADRFLPDKSKVYDLGCSTGNTIAALHQHLFQNKKQAHFIGVDASTAMLKKCEAKLSSHSGPIDYELELADIESFPLSDADLVIMNYTLQFIDPSKRAALLKNIYLSLKPGGLLILSEKLKSPFQSMDDLLIDIYYDFKRQQGYSQLEISQKREALENVLIPLTQAEQLELLKTAGFDQYEVLLRWSNFASFVATKNRDQPDLPIQ